MKIGNQLEQGTIVGPLHNQAAVALYRSTIEKAVQQGGKILVGGNVLKGPGNFVEPTLIRISPDAEIIKTEAFVPISYVMEYSDLDQAIQYNNNVSQGLSSALFTNQVSFPIY